MTASPAATRREVPRGCRLLSGADLFRNADREPRFCSGGVGDRKVPPPVASWEGGERELEGWWGMGGGVSFALYTPRLTPTLPALLPINPWTRRKCWLPIRSPRRG
jgi:hypothetical protein